MAVSANARLPAPRSSRPSALAAPAAWNTAAGAVDDEFYSRYDPWVEPKRSGKLWFVLAGLLLLIAAATSVFVLFRQDGGRAVSKATYGAVTTQQAGQPARPSAAMASRNPLPADAGKPVEAMPPVTRMASAPKLADHTQTETKQATPLPTPKLAMSGADSQGPAAQAHADTRPGALASAAPNAAMAGNPADHPAENRTATAKPQVTVQANAANGATGSNTTGAASKPSSVSGTPNPPTGLIAANPLSSANKAAGSTQANPAGGSVASNTSSATGKAADTKPSVPNALVASNQPAVPHANTTANTAASPSSVPANALASKQSGMPTGTIASNPANAVVKAPASNQAGALIASSQASATARTAASSQPGAVASTQTNAAAKALTANQSGTSGGLAASTQTTNAARTVTSAQPATSAKSAVSGQPGALVASSQSNNLGKAASSDKPVASTALTASGQTSAAAKAPMTTPPGTASALVASTSNQANVTTTPSGKPLSAAQSSAATVADSKQRATPPQAASKAKDTVPAATTRMASTTPPPATAKHDSKADAKPVSEQAAREASRNLQTAHAMLARDDISNARSHLTTALAAQPKNRDAQDMDATLTTREQQRDAILQAARNCESTGRWICAWHNAGSAMVIDSGSADAKRILSHAMQEAQAARTPAAPSALDLEPPHAVPDHH
ncbi:hypothetical protein [Paraburkholderia sp. DHOC27]|uniref:hypothetical protein n=1 Tax=Paraburkholderia sp. DHOC27 TaxID=2303330 RepID=UPI000E3E2CBD|nr:hypothetical protein [Paraburkholderia sp. DHOC27]RFU45941.1 hypothetical protein D0B32_19960 [Paraburkholderia sp. DHOC27]